MNTNNSKINPKLSIGLPVYNGEEFLEKKLESILSQTFSDYELIISDNNSTDSTNKICEQFLKKDKRIKYFQQKQNMGANWNFNFVLSEAIAPFFLWVGVNDKISNKFLEKNMNILENDQKIVGSISKIKPLKNFGNKSKETKIDSFFQKIIKKSRSIKTIDSLPIFGTYEEKIRFYLKNSTCQLIYGVFRTNELKESVVQNSFIGNDWATMIKILKFGNFHIVEEDIMYEHLEGLSSKGITNISKLYGHKNLNLIFPWYQFTKWYLNNFKIKYFLKNLDYFTQLNLEGVVSLFLDKLQIFFSKNSKNSE
jgi:glycosyltransferase involved in cell wall biosynthesis